MTVRGLMIIVGALMLAACGSNVRSFDLPLAELKQRVSEVEASPTMLQSRGVSTSREVLDDSVAWKLYADGEEVFRIVATLAADGDARSTLAMAFVPGEKAKAREIKNPDGIAKIKSFYLIAQEEQILAHLERRSIDMGRITAAMMRAALANEEAIFGSAGKAAANSEQRDRENVNLAYEEAGQGQ